MLAKDNRKHSVARTIVTVLCVLFLAAFLNIEFAMASPIENSEIKNAANQIPRIAYAISLPIAAIGLAVCGFKIFTGNEKQVEIAKKTAIYIGIAMVALALFGPIVKLVYGLIQSGAIPTWTPPEPPSTP